MRFVFRDTQNNIFVYKDFFVEIKKKKNIRNNQKTRDPLVITTNKINN